MSRDALVDALYARVIRRVCERFEQQRAGDADGHGDSERLALMEQQWRERLSRYTGRTQNRAETPPTAPARREEKRVSVADDQEANDDLSDDLAEAGAQSAQPQAPARGVAGVVAMGRPASVYRETAPQPSIFARMMHAKRNLDQLDGETSDASSSSEPAVPPRCLQAQETPHSSDIAPVTTLSLSRFPLQCSARDVNFAYKKNTLRGRWKSIVVTLLRRVGVDEMLESRQLLWLVGRSESVGGVVVEVADSSTSERGLVEVRAENQAETRLVDRNDLRRFFECVVCKGYSRFECLYQ